MPPCGPQRWVGRPNCSCQAFWRRWAEVGLGNERRSEGAWHPGWESHLRGSEQGIWEMKTPCPCGRERGQRAQTVCFLKVRLVSADLSETDSPVTLGQSGAAGSELVTYSFTIEVGKLSPEREVHTPAKQRVQQLPGKNESRALEALPPSPALQPPVSHRPNGTQSGGISLCFLSARWSSGTVLRTSGSFAGSTAFLLLASSCHPSGSAQALLPPQHLPGAEEGG